MTTPGMLQIDMLVPGILGKRDEYGRRYCGGKPMMIARGIYDWHSSSNLAELNAVLQKHLLIRRLKKNVLQDLPAKLRQRVPIEVDPDCVGVSALGAFVRGLMCLQPLKGSKERNTMPYSVSSEELCFSVIS